MSSAEMEMLIIYRTEYPKTRKVKGRNKQLFDGLFILRRGFEFFFLLFSCYNNHNRIIFRKHRKTERKNNLVHHKPRPQTAINYYNCGIFPFSYKALLMRWLFAKKQKRTNGKKKNSFLKLFDCSEGRIELLVSKSNQYSFILFFKIWGRITFLICNQSNR